MRNVSSPERVPTTFFHNESLNPKMQGRFETIFHESVLGVDYAGHVVLVKCYSGMANAACEVFDAL